MQTFKCHVSESPSPQLGAFDNRYAQTHAMNHMNLIRHVDE
jgi:hypothetical protein